MNDVMDQIVKEYTNGEVTIVWKPDLCIHIMHCWKELPEVFNPQKRPWINAQGASTERIIKQVKRCPSGALSYYMNGKKDEDMEKENQITAEVIQNGPLLVSGPVCVKRNGNEEEHSNGVAFCRCGKSKNQPYCDGSHIKNPFE